MLHASQVSMEISAAYLNEDEENCGKVDNTKADDHIGGLPEDILSSILSRLTMRDAVKARVLASSWRYLSASTSNLNFDLFTLFGIKYDKHLINKDLYDRFQTNRFRFITTVDQILQFFGIPKIYSLKISYCLGNESAHHIDTWISYAVRLQTEKLHLDFICTPRTDQRYKFPNLLELDFAQSCMLRPSPDVRNSFNSLKTLILHGASVDQRAFDGIVSGCINLERLRLEDCCLPNLFLISGPSLCLKLLVLDDCYGSRKIEISSIVLAEFEYMGEITNLVFVGFPSIDKVLLRFHRSFQTGARIMFCRLAKTLPQLRIVSLFFSTTEVRRLPENITKFCNLKEMELLVFLVSSLDLLSVVFILNAAATLQKFHLALRNRGPKPPLVKREYTNQLHYHLKEVEISGFINSCNALDLAVYILNNAVGLERMIIDFNKVWSFGSERWVPHPHPCRQLEENQKLVRDLLSKERPGFWIKLELIGELEYYGAKRRIFPSKSPRHDQEIPRPSSSSRSPPSSWECCPEDQNPSRTKGTK